MATISPPARADAEAIAERITLAIMEHRLPPGGKLAEERLAAAFGVSRTRVRQALVLLGNEGLVKLHPNRGAFVASPSVEEARNLFATRRLLEPEIVRNVIERAGDDASARLHQHLAREADARKKCDRRAIIKLSGEFHMLLAELAGNPFIGKLMDELCPLTCLIIALYDAPNTPACPDDEHEAIVAAIGRKDQAEAIRLMLAHLNHVERELHLTDRDDQQIQWDRLIG